jgi:hypothetical protein
MSHDLVLLVGGPSLPPGGQAFLECVGVEFIANKNEGNSWRYHAMSAD